MSGEGWSVADLEVLRGLREGFLRGNAGERDYWKSARELELYDGTFAQRIGWKWDAVWGELELRGWRPRGSRVIDFGCGTGIAARRFWAQWSGFRGQTVVSDRSRLARGYAVEALKEQGVGELGVCEMEPGAVDFEGALVLLSHVLTELTREQVAGLVARLAKAQSVVWVESATHEASRRLVEEVRERFCAMGGGETERWGVVAPCTHQSACPLREEAHAAHWCHHFARVPSAAHQDPGLRMLSRELGVDMRVLPYSFVVLDRGKREVGEEGEGAAGGMRVLGRAREFKGHLKVLGCQKEGVVDWTLQKRDVPEVFRALRKEEGVPLYQCKTEGNRIIGAQRLYAEREGDGERAGE